MAKRVFVALKISVQLQKKIAAWEEQWTNLPVRWLSGKNLHITLIPPWHVQDAGNVKKLLENIRGECGPFIMKFERATFGPDPHEPKLIWAEGRTPQQIIELKKLLETTLDQKPQRRDFKLHLTLARFRPENFQSFAVKKLDEKVDWEENAAAVVLMESHLSPNGSEYEILHEIPL